MKKVSVEKALGMILAHDITEIIPGKKKDVAFQRGRVIEKGDVEKLLDLGKRYLFVFEGSAKGVHEDDASTRIAQAILGEHCVACHTLPASRPPARSSTGAGIGEPSSVAGTNTALLGATGFAAAAFTADHSAAAETLNASASAAVRPRYWQRIRTSMLQRRCSYRGCEDYNISDVLLKQYLCHARIFVN
mgnify:CR=1 FL=1